MMKNVGLAQSGSALLIVMCVMSLLIVLAHNVIRNSCFAYDVSLRAIKQEQSYRTQEALLNFAIASVLNNLRDGNSYKIGEWIFEVDKWLEKSDGFYMGKLVVKSTGNKVEIQSFLLNKQKDMQNKKRAGTGLACVLSLLE